MKRQTDIKKKSSCAIFKKAHLPRCLTQKGFDRTLKELRGI